MSYTFHNENKAWLETPDKGTENETDGDFVADPTAQTGTLDTSDTTGTSQSVDSVSAVFDVADQTMAEHAAPEGTVSAPDIDPGATGDDALEPDYSEQAQTAAEERNAALGGQTTDTTGDGVAPVAGEPEPSVGEENRFDGRKDSGDYTVKEVQAYLDGATDRQKESVKAKAAKGQNRAGIMNA